MAKLTTFKQVLTLRLLLVAVIPVLLIATASIQYLTDATGRNAAATNLQLAKSVRAEITEFLDDITSELHNIHTVVEGQYVAAARINSLLRTRVERSESLEALFILDTKGQMLHAGLSPAIALDEKYYMGLDFSGQIDINNVSWGINWSHSFISVVTGAPTISITLIDEDHIVAANISLRKLFDKLATLKLPGDMSAAIIDNKGVLIAHPNSVYVDQRLNISNLEPARQALAGREGSFPYSFENVEQLGSVARIPAVDWSVVVSQSLDDAYGVVGKVRTIAIVGVLLTAILAFIYALISARRMLRPLDRLTQQVNELADNDYRTAIDPLPYAEWDQVAHAFQKLVHRVSDREDQLDQNLRRYEDLANLLPQTVIETDSNGQLSYLNAMGQRVFGYGSKDLAAGLAFTDLFIVEQRPLIQARLNDLLQGKAMEGMECAALRRQGVEFPVMLYANRVEHEGEVCGLRAVVFDITQRKAAEQQIQERLAIERAITAISNHFISVSIDEIDVAIAEALKVLGEFLVADRCYLYVFEEETCVVGQTHYWCAEGVNAFDHLVRGLDIETLPWAFKHLNELGILVIPNVADLPDTAAAERQLFSNISVSSMVALPLVLGERNYGLIGADSVEQLHDWSEEDLLLLKMVAQTLVNAFERVRAFKELELSATVFENSQEAIFITDAEQHIIQANSEFTHLTGYKESEVLGKKPTVLSSGRHSADFYKDMWVAINSNGYWEGEIWNKRKSGEIFPEWLSISRVMNAQGDITNYVATFSDITVRKQTEDRLRYLAHYDSLTQMPNRNLFQQRLNHALKQARRVRRQVAVLFLDLDRFKVINDTLGHDVGDQLLKQVAERLVVCVRASDTVSRIGGDEFTFILEGVRNIEDVSLVAQKVIETMEPVFGVDEHEVFMTTSIGISIYPDDGTDEQALLKNADTAMYRAKDLGRNNYQFYTEDMNARSLERLVLENQLRRALERDEFVVFYQPQIDLAQGRVIGAEALVRWNNPDMGLISPVQFIPLAEESGLIEPLGEWVLECACRQAMEWQAKGFGELRMAVNLSARQFRAPDLIPRITSILEQSGLDPTLLELELTESVIMNDVDENIGRLRQLQDMGINLAIDDFGTGYSSLSYLKRFPINRVKIDRSFISDLTNDVDDAAIVYAIIALAHSLQIEVIAEGVETMEQRDFLRANECDEAQGYLFSPPVPNELIERMLLDQGEHPTDPASLPVTQ